MPSKLGIFKEANFSEWFKDWWKYRLGGTLRSLKYKSTYQNFYKDNKATLIGGALGIPAGADIGNMIYNNSIPAVKALPQLSESQTIEPQNQNSGY